ncbi:MAG: glycoside hydrolase family 3 protein [Chloroflexota bacterium]
MTRLIGLALISVLVATACRQAAVSSVVEQATPGVDPPATVEAPAVSDDVPVEDRIADLVSRMTLSEKIGQMTLVEKDSIDPDDIAPLGIGGILSGGGGSPDDNSAEGWSEMVNGFQSKAKESRLGIPLLYGVDAVHGHANLRGATVFPQNIGLGATGDPELVRAIGRATAVEMAATGIRWNYAPVVAVPQDIRWGRTYEAYSDDTDLVTKLSAAYLLGLQDAGDGLGLTSPSAVLGTPKHFIGDGGTTWGTSTQNIMDTPYQLDQGDTQMDEATLRDLFLPPYAQAIEDGALSIMASFSSWNGEKVHGSHYLLTDLLKDELGFDGFVVSDWQGVDQVDSDYQTAVIRSINAGVDMNMVPYEYQRFIATLTEAVENGDVPMERIDDAVTRILRAKFALGLFDESNDSDAVSMESVGSAEHRELAREAVRRSLVVLENQEQTLPLKKDAPVILVAGEGADDIGLQSGGWTIEWQGAPGAITNGTTILEGIKATADPDSLVLYNRFGNFDRNLANLDVDPADITAVVVVAEQPYAEGVGDRADLTLPEADVALIEKVATQSGRVVVVLLSGRPLIITEQLPLADAWVAAWLPGSEGDGVAEVLFGEYPFTGKLSYDWPASMQDVPLPDTGADPLFPRGYGLTTN